MPISIKVANEPATVQALAFDFSQEPRPDPGDSPAACDIGAYELQDVVFAGQPGKENCQGKSVSALAKQYAGMDAAAWSAAILRKTD